MKIEDCNCKFKNSIEENDLLDTSFKKIQYEALTLEQQSEWMKKCGKCPYHYTLYALNRVDIVCMPYNYLLNSEMRK